MKFNCKNKRCNAEFYSSENKKIINCPICNAKVYNIELIINTKNCLWIETMIKNIETYGENTFQMIDKCYHNASTRARIRQLYLQTIKQLKEN